MQYSKPSRDLSSGRLIDWGASLKDFGRAPRPLLRRTASLVVNSLRGNVVHAPTALCINSFAYSFGEGGWHYYMDLARQLLEEPEAPLEGTGFHRFFRGVRAPSTTDMLSFHDPELRASLPPLPYGSFPWGPYEWFRVEVDPDRFFDRAVKPRRTGEGSGLKPGYSEYVFYEKSPEVGALVRKKFEKFRTLVRSFQTAGYRPLLGDSLLPTAGVLIAASGETRFMLRDGSHRLAVLSALGCRRAWLRLDPRRFPPVYENAAADWPWVRSRLLRVEDARRMFRLFFELNGSERARALGIALPAAAAPLRSSKTSGNGDNERRNP